MADFTYNMLTMKGQGGFSLICSKWVGAAEQSRFSGSWVLKQGVKFSQFMILNSNNIYLDRKP